MHLEGKYHISNTHRYLLNIKSGWSNLELSLLKLHYSFITKIQQEIRKFRALWFEGSRGFSDALRHLISSRRFDVPSQILFHKLFFWYWYKEAYDQISKKHVKSAWVYLLWWTKSVDKWLAQHGTFYGKAHSTKECSEPVALSAIP
jgi:hypothetical protein